MHPVRKHKKRSIQNSDPGKILDLILSLNEPTCTDVQIKVNTYLSEECDADMTFHIIVHTERLEAYIEAVGSLPLQRKLKVHMCHKMCEMVRAAMEHSDFVTHFETGIKDIIIPPLREILIQQKIDKKDVDKVISKKRVVILPTVDKPFSVLTCVVGSKHLEEMVAIAIHECLLFVWPTLNKNIILEYECTLKHKCQQLLRVAKRLFTQVASLETLLQIAMEQAKILAKAEYCSVKLVDVDHMQLVEAGHPPKKTVDDTTSERRFPMDIGIAGHVIQTGHVVNSRCAKECHEFNETIDTLPGVECRQLLCFPIREQTGIIGVGQLINKVGDPYFDCMDEEMALAFSIYCGVCIMHSVVYQKIQEAHIRNTLANELVMYHMKVSDAEVAKMLSCTGYHDHPHLKSLHFNARTLAYKELPCYILRMFTDLSLDKKFEIKKSKLCRFILHVKKGYRDVPYHNWLHAFNVAQWAYAAMMNFKLSFNGYFNDLQMLMYLVAAVSHDLDHRGTTNSFHLQGQTTLAALYSSEGSVMERHHLAQAMCILNTEGCDILETLPRRDYDRAIMLLRDFILASDLANYFKNLNDYKTISMDFQKNNRVHVSALQSILMNCADLGDQLKDWNCVKKTAASVLTEFFKQGDVEKSRGDLPPIIMDRDKCFIPELEIQFLQTTCAPLFGLLGNILPKVVPCLKIIENHIEKWDAAKPIFSEVPIMAGLSVLLSPDLDNLIELNIEEKARKAEEERLAAIAAEEAARLAAEQVEEESD